MTQNLLHAGEDKGRIRSEEEREMSREREEWDENDKKGNEERIGFIWFKWVFGIGSKVNGFKRKSIKMAWTKHESFPKIYTQWNKPKIAKFLELLLTPHIL